MQDPQQRKGMSFAVLAYGMWGLLPVYWKQLAAYPSWQLVAHRLLWSALLLGLLVLAQGRATRLLRELRRPAVLRSTLSAGLLILGNWLTFVWAVNHGHIVESSLGYFINPLFSVSLGVLLLGERMRPAQWTAVLLAALGMLLLGLRLGRIPWIALALAAAFGLYGLVKKRSPLGSVDGLAAETLLLGPLALAALLVAEFRGTGAFLHHGAATDLLLAGTGLITATPLLLFAAAARRIPLFWIGMLQYLAPTGQFLIGVFVYHEALDSSRLGGFALVWSALLLLTLEGIRQRSRRPQG